MTIATTTMRAAVTPIYGPASVLETRDLPTPRPGDREVIVEMRATPVTAGDLRMRAGDFPSITALPGRLMLGVRGPRNAVQGTMFAGRIVEVGSAVSRYAVGDDVFGSSGHGAYAELVRVREDAAMAKMPSNVSYDEAAAVPYGGVTALRFLRDLAAVRPRERVLVVGAAGGVGRFAVQIAKHLGAEVTGVCSRKSFDLVRALGADHLVDYERESFTESGRRYHVVFDTADVTRFERCRSALTDDGRYMTLTISVGMLAQMALTSMGGGPRVKFGIALGDADDMIELRDLLERGVLRPIIGERFPLERITEAHAAAALRRGSGAVVVTAAGRA